MWRDTGVFFAKLRKQHGCLSRVSDALVGFLVGFFSLRECTVVQKAVPVKLEGKRSILISRWIQTVFEGLDYKPYYISGYAIRPTKFA